MKYPEDGVQSQYAASPVIRSLVDGMNSQIDPELDVKLFYDKIFNIYTAQGWGLDNWGRILGIGRILNVEPEDFFGFEGSGLKSFDQQGFYYPWLTNNYRLEDTPYRQLLLYKAAANIAASDLSTLNRLLNQIFGGRGAYIVESGVMSIRFYFEFHLTPYERALMRLDFIPPRPAGVGYEWIEAPPAETFGFNGSFLQPFEQGTFNQGPKRPVNGGF